MLQVYLNSKSIYQSCKNWR